jgi:membrane protein DedA with SNARE-associated domain
VAGDVLFGPLVHRGSAPVGKNRPMEHFVQSHLASSGYPALFVLALLGAMCIPFPSEITFGFAGFLSSSAFVAKGHGAHLRLWEVIVLGVVATVLGATIAYVVGRVGGRAFVDRYGKFVLLTHEDLDRTEALFSRWGDGLVAVGQSIPLLRSFVGFGAGVAKVRPVPFLALTTLGAAVWVTAISLIGYEAGSSWNKVLRWFGDAGYVAAALVIIAIVVGIVHRWRKVHAAPPRDAAR